MKKIFNRSFYFLIVIAIISAIGFGCSELGTGENAVIHLNIGGNPGKAVSIGDLRHEIVFSGPTGVKTFNVTGAGSISAAVAPGQWTISVQGYYGDELYSTGSETVDVKAGKNISVIIQMTVVWSDPADATIQTPQLPPLEIDEIVTDWASLQAYIHGLVPSASEPIVSRTIMLDDLGILGAFAANSDSILIPYSTLNPGEEVVITLVVSQGKTMTLTRGSLTGYMFNVGGTRNNGTLNLGHPNYPQNSSLVLDGTGTTVNGSLVTVGTGSIFNMYDRVKLQNNVLMSGDGSAVMVESTGTFNMFGGEITGNSCLSSGDGGGVCVNEGIFNMAGGTIGPDNKASSGGGVYVFDGVFNLSGGEVKGNTAQNYGGGVYAYALSPDKGLYMTGGTIGPDNIASGGWGGGVYIDDAELIMSGGGIIGNKAQNAYGSAQGGGVYITNSGSGFVFKMSGTAKINGNFAIDTGTYGAQGGGVLIASGISGQLKMEGSAEICNNTAQATGSNPAQGGGICFLCNGATFDMVSGNPKINGNIAVSDINFAYGGGVYMGDGTLTMSAGEINGNTADGFVAFGGGVYVGDYYGASFTKSGGTILPNIISYFGPFLPNTGEAVFVDTGSTPFGCDGAVPNGVSTSLPSGAWDF